jgi:hypothetical protein
VDANEVVPEGIERDHVRVIFQFFAEGVCQSGKAPHRHPHQGLLAADNPSCQR